MGSFDFTSLVEFLTALFNAFKNLAASLGIDFGGEDAAE